MSFRITCCALYLAAVATGCAHTEPAPKGEATPVLRPDTQAQDSGDPGESDEFVEFDEFDDETATDGEVFDPLGGFNRGIYHFNDAFFVWVWRPTAKGYRFVVPEPVRVAVDRAFRNFRAPIRLANCPLQLKMEKTGIELGRVLVNSTLGVGGLFDAAQCLFDLREPSPEDFGQTLGHYGVGEGFPIVLPLLGPSSLRDGLGMIPDAFAHPIVYFVPIWATVGLVATDKFNHSSLHIGEYASFKQDALDPYTFFRDAYHQNREKKIQD